MSTTYTRRHLRVGWWSILIFLTLGILLESLHGFKVGWYLNVSSETRRLMWTLAHAHGVLLGLLHVAFGLTLRVLRAGDTRWQRWASSCLIGATMLIPGGFFLGGLVTHGGDPGLAVLLVAPGGVLLGVAVVLTARATARVGAE